MNRCTTVTCDAFVWIQKPCWEQKNILKTLNTQLFQTICIWEALVVPHVTNSFARFNLVNAPNFHCKTEQYQCLRERGVNYILNISNIDAAPEGFKYDFFLTNDDDTETISRLFRQCA